MSDVKVLFSGRGHEQDLKTTQTKTVTKMHSKKTFFILLPIHRIRKKKISYKLRPFLSTSHRGKHLGDLTIQTVKEKTQKPEGLTRLR
jgi:hypothetical protein